MVYEPESKFRRYSGSIRSMSNRFCMQNFDLKIPNGTVANSAETFTGRCRHVSDGRIVAIGKRIWS